MPRPPSSETFRLAEALPKQWRAVVGDVLEKPWVPALERFLEDELARGAKVLPPLGDVFTALALTPPDAVKAVLLGQDPYPTEGFAHGLAFSVRREVGKVPPSLKNLYKVLQCDLGLTPPAHGELTAWAKSGVLLLNTCLTVRQGEPNAHAKKGWEELTRAILTRVAERPQPMAFLLLGNSAQACLPLLHEHPNHLVVKGPHPSPLNGRKFCDWGEVERPFSKVNAFLERHGVGAIDWRLE